MVVDKRQAREAFLLALYDLTDADPMQSLDFRQVAQRIGLDEQEGGKVAQYLVDRSLAQWQAMGGEIGIAPYGVDEAERLQDQGVQPPLSVVVLSEDEHAAVEAFLTAFRQSEEKGELALAHESRVEVEADVATLEAQMRSPRPKRRVVRLVVHDIHTVLLGAAGSGAFVAIQKLLQQLN